MQHTRFVRTLVFFVTLGLGGLLLGCSGEKATGPTPEKKEENKKIAAEFKEQMRQQKAARGQQGGR
jgi:hypothetical protein